MATTVSCDVNSLVLVRSPGVLRRVPGGNYEGEREGAAAGTVDSNSTFFRVSWWFCQGHESRI